MNRKIVAIGGGFNGRLKDDGTYDPYETGPMDQEIIRITGKKILIFYLLRIRKRKKKFKNNILKLCIMCMVLNIVVNVGI